MKEKENTFAKTASSMITDERGVFAVIFALMLLVLLGFMALGVEAGRWYLVRAELSKGVDAAALAAARNIGGTVNPVVLANEFGNENFRHGYLDTPGSGVGDVQFSATMPTANQVNVTGNVHATPILARLFGVGQIPVSATGAATMRDVEILMILDRSGSMAGAKMTALQNAATGFLQFFAATQDTDRMGLISFATTVSAPIDRPMGFNYVAPMTNAINAMVAVGATNHEDALDRARTAGGFTDQAGVPPANQRFAQFVVFFTDGMPTALRDQFRYNGQLFDGVVYGVGSSGHANCMTSDYPYMSVNNTLTRPDGSGTYPGVNPATTGDGRSVGASACAGLNTKWNILEPLPVPGYAAEHCSIPMNRLLPHFCDLTRQLALRNAQTLKDSGILIYVIGLGNAGQINQNFLTSLSSGAQFTYIAPTPADLATVFNQIARAIRLRLVR
jgi:hypothetical protein